MSQLQDYACASDRVMDVTENNSIGIYVTTLVGVSVSVPPLGVPVGVSKDGLCMLLTFLCIAPRC